MSGRSRELEKKSKAHRSRRAGTKRLIAARRQAKLSPTKKRFHEVGGGDKLNADCRSTTVFWRKTMFQPSTWKTVASRWLKWKHADQEEAVWNAKQQLRGMPLPPDVKPTSPRKTRVWRLTVNTRPTMAAWSMINKHHRTVTWW